MAQPSRRCSYGVVRLVLFVVGLFLIGYVVGLPFFWHSKGNLTARECPSCACDCSSENSLSLPLGSVNNSFADCGKDDPDVNEEMKKDFITLLSEEISLQRNVTNDNLEHTKALIMDVKKTSSHYQKEAEKCTSGMETCEGARENAVAALIEERKLSILWEERAREHGWKDKR